MHKNALVLTTIRIPNVLESYINNFKKYGHEAKDTAIIVVGDLKTPKGIYDYVAGLKREHSSIVYLSPRDQEEWLEPYSEFRSFLPYNSVERRNIGFLYAAELGAERIITIDDDNFAIDSIDYLSSHSVVGEKKKIPAVFSESGWVNICELLETEPARRFYHRGFPIDRRWKPENKMQFGEQEKRIAVNAGLWMTDPDVDTFTRLEEPFMVTRYKHSEKHIGLGEKTFHPFNSQNTCFIRDLLPCAYLITIGKVDESNFVNTFRFDDIWMSYFAQIAIRRMGHQVSFGFPLVSQKRNSHDLVRDFSDEFLPAMITPKLVDHLQTLKLTATTYSEAYWEIIDHFEVMLSSGSLFSPIEKNLMRKALEGMRLWANVSGKILGTK